MTREEREKHLDWLYRLKSEIFVFMPKEWLIPMADALDMAIKALEQEPYDDAKYHEEHGEVVVDKAVWEDAKRALELCEDAISREELLKAIDTWDKFGCDADTKLVPYQDHYIPYIHYDDVIKCIKGIPSVKLQEPKTGHWKRISIDKYSEHAKIKSMESEDVLNKIRAEIELLHHHPKVDFIKNDEIIEMVLYIIDKYRNEVSHEADN